MPGIIIHTEIARRVAESLGRKDLLEEKNEISRIYFQGAMAPDMGVFPGCNPLLSTLPHYISTGELVRELLRNASNENQNAFALGWLTHYLADVRIHPLINRAAAECASPGMNSSITWEQNPVLHVQVEQGLDGEMYYELEVRPFMIGRSLLAKIGRDFLPAIFHRVYQVRFTPDDFLFSFKRAQYYHRLMRDMALIHQSLRGHRLPDFSTYQHLLFTWLPVAVMNLLIGRRSPYFRIARVIAPSPQLKDQVRVKITEVVAEAVAACNDSRWPLPDYNLDTGELACPGKYRAADQARTWLSEMTPKL